MLRAATRPSEGRARQVVAEPAPQRLPGVVDHQVDAVQPAPDHEGPAGAVPQPAEQHRDHQVGVAARRAAPVAAERDVEVVAQEARQRDVPAAPEVDDVDRLVGAVEVDREADVEHQRRGRSPCRSSRRSRSRAGRCRRARRPRPRTGSGRRRPAPRRTPASRRPAMPSASTTFLASPIDEDAEAEREVVEVRGGRSRGS